MLKFQHIDNYFANVKIEILGVKIDKITNTETLRSTEGFLSSDKAHHIVTLNSEMVLVAQKDENFKKIINDADLTVADGAGLLWAATFLKKKNSVKIFRLAYNFFLGIFLGLSLVFYPKYCRQILPERISGVDLMISIINKYREKNIKIFLLGAKEGVAKLAAHNLEQRCPEIKIAGYFSGDGSENGDKIAVSIINQVKPDVLFVAYGAPKQEKWISRNLHKIPSVKLAMGVGGAFDMISGRIERAPIKMREAGLEWLWRLAKEPGRIKRIYNATIKFTWMVLTNPVKNSKHDFPIKQQ